MNWGPIWLFCLCCALEKNAISYSKSYQITFWTQNFPWSRGILMISFLVVWSLNCINIKDGSTYPSFYGIILLTDAYVS